MTKFVVKSSKHNSSSDWWNSLGVDWSWKTRVMPLVIVGQAGKVDERSSGVSINWFYRFSLWFPDLHAAYPLLVQILSFSLNNLKWYKYWEHRVKHRCCLVKRSEYPDHIREMSTDSRWIKQSIWAGMWIRRNSWGKLRSVLGVIMLYIYRVLKQSR